MTLASMEQSLPYQARRGSSSLSCWVLLVDFSRTTSGISIGSIPIGSMYGAFAVKNQPNVGKSSIPMDPMG